MATDVEVVEISLLSGRSDRPSMTFVPGTPAPTVSLGSAGQWAVAGEGVGPVHVFVTFDGQSVHVAAAVPNLPVMLAGAPVGQGWTRAPIPCELRFGGACVILRRTSRPSSFAGDEATVHDGGALLQAGALRAGQANATAIDLSQTQQSPTIIPSMRPAAGTPAETTEIVAAPAFAQTLASHGSVPPPPPIDLTKTTPMADAQKFRDAVNAAQGQSRESVQPETMRQQLVPTAGPVPSLGEMEKTVVAPHPPRPPQGVPDLVSAMAGDRAAPLPPIVQAQTAQPVGAPPPPAAAKAPNFWQEASPVKKATLVLLPFTLVAAYFMFMSEPPAPAPRRAAAKHVTDGGVLTATASSADGGATPTGALTAIPDAAAATTEPIPPEPKQAKEGKEAKDGKEEPAAKVTPLAGSKRTPERAALDSVAAGSFEEAARKYDALAGAHADDPSYKEAARILHEKAGN